MASSENEPLISDKVDEESGLSKQSDYALWRSDLWEVCQLSGPACLQLLFQAGYALDDGMREIRSVIYWIGRYVAPCPIQEGVWTKSVYKCDFSLLRIFQIWTRPFLWPKFGILRFFSISAVCCHSDKSEFCWTSGSK